MPPKEDTNTMDGRTLYFKTENGELRPIGKVSEIEVTELAPDTDLEDIIPEEYRLPTTQEFSFSIENVRYELYTQLHKLTFVNNYRRLHGLRPVRHKVWRHNPYAAKRMGKLFRRGGFKFK